MNGSFVGHVGGGADGRTVWFAANGEIISPLIALTAIERLDLARGDLVGHTIEARRRSYGANSMALPDPSLLLLLKASV